MAQAMVKPLVSTGLMKASDISVFDVSKATLEHIQTQNEGIRVSQSISDAVNDAELIVCAVKPQNLSDSFFAEFANRSPNATVLSIVAGTPISTFEQGFNLKNNPTTGKNNNNDSDNNDTIKIARTMPNTPAQIGEGVTVWCCTPNIPEDERDKIDQILCCFGKSIYVDDEKYIDMSTSLSGSGPAYVFMIMEAMIDAGVHMGFSRDVATTLTNQTLLGSTLYAIETKEHPAVLRNKVTSPAGTTASAIYELENGKLRTVINDTVWACYRRSLEMGGHDSNVGPGRTKTVPPPPVVAPPTTTSTK